MRTRPRWSLCPSPFFPLTALFPKKEETIAVIGLGVIGLYAIQVLKAVGVDHVLAAGRRPARLNAAKRCGADLVIDAAAEDSLAAVMAATGQLGVNTVVECAGTQTTFDQAVAMARGGGKVLLVGVYEEPLTWDPLPVIGKNLSLIGCLGGNFPAAIDLLKSGRVNAQDLITHRFSLDEAAQAFHTQFLDPTAIKVMIKP